MTDEDTILNSTAVYSEEEVLALFQECCESEAEAPGHYTERLKLAAEGSLPDVTSEKAVPAMKK